MDITMTATVQPLIVLNKLIVSDGPLKIIHPQFLYVDTNHYSQRRDMAQRLYPDEETPVSGYAQYRPISGKRNEWEAEKEDGANGREELAPQRRRWNALSRSISSVY